MTDDAPDPKILEEAALIFLRLREEPDNPDAIADKNRFVAKGPLEKAAFEKIQSSWRLSSGQPRRKHMFLVPALLALGATLYFSAEPLRISLLADAATGSAVETTSLRSGDGVTLDASSALRDHTLGETRQVQLLRGAAVFEVSKQDAPFAMTLGDVRVDVRSTVFETVLWSEGSRVSVIEGAVDVTHMEEVRVLNAGEQMTIDAAGRKIVHDVDVETIAKWRENQMIVTDTSVAQLVDVLDRRMVGKVFVMGSHLSETRVSGSFDLENPASALRSLAVVAGARVYSAGPFGTILIPEN